MDLACNCVRNSEQFGTAVLVVRSYKLLQSVIAKSFSSSLAVGTEKAGGRFCTLLGFCHLIDGLKSHAQYNRNHVN